MAVHPAALSLSPRALRRAACALALASAAVLSGCASAPRIVADQAAGVDLATYPSFGFVDPLGLEREGYSTLAGDRARTALGQALEAKGYRFDREGPALRVNVLPAAAQRESRGPRVSLGLGLGLGGGSTRGGIGLGLPLGGSKTQESRLPAAVTVDLVDAAANRVVWSGSVALTRDELRQGDADALAAALSRLVATVPARSAATPR